MAYVSPITPGVLYIPDHELSLHAKPFAENEQGVLVSSSGFIARDYDKQPLGSIAGTTAFPAELLLDDQQLAERIEELERTKTDLVSLLQYLWDNKQWIGLNQDPTNYCWCFAVIHAIMILRAMAGEPFKRLSPFSVACFVKDFRNIGGWGGEANERCVSNGVCTEEFWPFGIPGSGNVQAANMNAIRNGRQYVESSKANAALHTVKEWWELEPRNNRQKLSALCIPLPVPSGYNQIGHERCSVKATRRSDGSFGVVDLDSYTQRGEPDLKEFSIRKMPADDAVIPRAITPSNL
jgi:hypothetical protein